MSREEWKAAAEGQQEGAGENGAHLGQRGHQHDLGAFSTRPCV